MYSTTENSKRCDVWKIIQLASTVQVLVFSLSLGSSSAFTCPAYDSGARISSMSAKSRISTGTCLYSTASPPSEESTAMATATVQKKKPRAWFPVKPEDALLTQYDTLVRGAFVRHVVMETEAVTDLALQTYLRGDMESYENVEDKMDPFGKLARDLSACVKSREEAGKVGWVDNPFHPDFVDRKRNNDVTSELISPRVIEQLFQKRPKGGDVLKLKYSANTSEGNEDEFDFKGKKDQWHLCRVDDLMVDYINSEKDEATKLMEQETLAFKQRGINKVITNRSKLKGLGTTPVAPKFIQEGSENVGDQDEKGHMAKTYHIATSGCQMNVADSERLAGVLQNNLKLSPAQNPAKADVVILNTCSIRDHAEQKVYDALGPYAARKRRGEPLALIVAGCVAQQEGEALLKRVPEMDLVLGPQYVSRLGDLLDDVSRGHQVVATDPTLLSEDLSRPVRGHDVRAWINVINGCNEHCTYCVVPGVRGVEQSRPMEFILKECLDLAEAGFKEVTLLGQNIDAYGRDLTPRRNFADLLHYLNDAIPDGTIERIRYVTSHPRYFSDRVIDAVATLDKVCECFHMPFQSGGDIVLKNMRRGYTFDSYMKIINKIKEKAPDASICGDVIVGFPGETDEQFQRTLDLMNEVKFDNLNTFAYSPRPNTEAALWDNQISEEVKSERLQIVQRLAAQHGMERSERYVGTTIPILVEDRNPRNMNQVMGRTRQSRQVFFDGDIDELKGKTVEVKIVEARTWSLVGEVV